MHGQQNVNTSPCFKPFVMGNTSDKCLPTRPPIYVSFRYIFINHTNFLGIPTQCEYYTIHHS